MRFKNIIVLVLAVFLLMNTGDGAKQEIDVAQSVCNSKCPEGQDAVSKCCKDEANCSKMSSKSCGADNPYAAHCVCGSEGERKTECDKECKDGEDAGDLEKCCKDVKCHGKISCQDMGPDRPLGAFCKC